MSTACYACYVTVASWRSGRALADRFGIVGAGVLIGVVWQLWHWVPFLAQGRSWTWILELSEEVRIWYVGLTPAGKAATDRVLERLASQGHMLRMLHSRSLGGGLYELRFTCENVHRRITYVFDPERRAVTLTTFRKQRQNERAEVLRARRAQAAHGEVNQVVMDPDGKEKDTER